MRFFRTSILGAALVVVSAASLSAQTGAAPDSTRVATLATVTVTAESGNWFTRADDLRRDVVNLMAENRRLAQELRREDARVARLQTRLDSLKQVEAAQQAAIRSITDSVAATRARRRALEAKVIAAEIRLPER
jgi:predicted nuclease with TOPRIM domain